jgi:hypothetical protein
MMFAIASPAAYTNDFTALALVRDQSDSVEGTQSVTDIFSIREIRVGDTQYALRQPVTILPTIGENNQWICRLQGCAELVGTGKDRTDAFRNLQEVFHAAFQRLYAMRLFEMDDQDIRIWSYLTSITDVADYKQRTPLQVREIGQISFKKRSIPTQIRWIDGRKEPIYLQFVPDEMAGYRPGQWFESVSHRHPENGKLIRIASCQRIPAIHSAPPNYPDSLKPATLPIVESSLE